MIELLEHLSNILSNNLFIAPFIALIAGVLAALLPCSLTQLPLLIAYLGGYNNENKSVALKYSLYYALGNTVTFTLLGLLSALVGKSFSFLNKSIYIILGILTIIMFFQVSGIINILPNNIKKLKIKNKGFLSALTFGIIGGLFASPCSTPVLLAILSYVISTRNILLGIVMLFFYSIGNSIIIILFGSSITLADKFINSKKMVVIGKVLNIILSCLILILGLYMLYLGF